MRKAHKIKLYPTKAQVLYFNKACGISRFVYNWALDMWKKDWSGDGQIDAYALRKHLTKIKKDDFPWMLEVGKCCQYSPILNAQIAFKRFFKHQSKYPRFKKKWHKDCFLAIENNETFKQQDKKIWIPRLGWVKCAEDLRFIGSVSNVTVKRIANTWFAVVNIDTAEIAPIIKHRVGENQSIVGVDVGIKSMMVLSDGTIYENPRVLKKNMRRIKILQRRLSKKMKGSKNYNKQRMVVAKKHAMVASIRNNAIHQATAAIINNYQTIVIEDLRIDLMLKNRNLAKSAYDVSMGEVIRQLKYKSGWNGNELIVADRFFPSSKKCSYCGFKKTKLKLSERVFNCDFCGIKIDRDLNAAKNLSNYRPTEKSSESNACGNGSSVLATKLSPLAKQEIVFNQLKN